MNTVKFVRRGEMGQPKETINFDFVPLDMVPPPDATQKDKVGDWDEFAQTFCPFDLADLGEEFDEVFDNDVMISLDAFEEVNPAHVWTVIDGDDGELYLAEGFHYVNRLGYVLCRAPRQPNKDFSTNHYKVYTYSK